MWTREEIKGILLNEWDEADMGWPFPDERLIEIADSLVPVYYGEIIEQWREMPNEFDNSWKEIWLPDLASVTITSLMQTDLYNYYTDLVVKVYDQIRAEKEETENQEMEMN